MSVFFSADFSSLGAFSGTGGPTGIPEQGHLMPGLGCSAGSMLTCSGNPDAWVYETFAANLATLTLRGQIPVYNDMSGLGDGPWDVWGTETKAATPNSFTVPAVRVLVDGSDGRVGILIDATSQTPSVPTYSSAGLFPINGLPQALQAALTLTGTTFSWSIAVNNSSHFTGSVTLNTPGVQYLGRAYCFANRVPQCGFYVPSSLKGYVNGMTGFSYVELDNAATISTFNPCSGATALTFNTCWNPATMATVACDPVANTLTFTGIGLFGGPVPAAGFPSVIPYGPEGGQLLFNTITLTDTLIVLEITGEYDQDSHILPFTVKPGHYCLFIANVCA